MSNIISIDVAEVEGKMVAALPDTRFTNAGGKMEITVPKAPKDQTSQKWIEWGSNDKLPTEIREKIEKVPMAGTAIYKLISMMYGNGLAYYRNSDLQDGNLSPQRAYIPAVERFLKKNKIKNKWLTAQFADYRYYMNTFSELILNKRRDQIVGLYHKTAEFCRLSRQNEKTLNNDFLIYSADFAQGLAPTNDRRTEIPLFRWHDEEKFFKKLKGYKFAYHSRFETPGALFYARPFWLGLFRKNGWLDASASVPEIVNSMMRNQIVLKYQILIPETYFEVRHKDWSTYADEQKNKIINNLIDSINDSLSGTDNAYKSICSLFRQDISGNPLGKIEIIPIDDKMKKDNWVPSSEKADAQIVQGLGIHPSQIGLATEGGKMGAGSGSDQREGFNTAITLNTIDQEIVLEPLNYVAEFNKKNNPDWDITFFIDHTHHTTTNKQESGLVPSDNTITPQ